MNEAISRIRRHLQAGNMLNEAAVRETAVMPILASIGWEIFDPKLVSREYSLGNRRVDYALAPRNNVPSVIIEVKRPGHAIQADQQLFEYAFHAGVPLAVLTDGREWAFYLPSGQGSYAERRFYKLDIEERSDAEAIDSLTRYIGFANVSSGEYRRHAEQDYQQLRDSRVAVEALPKAWNAIISDRESLLFELLAEKAEDISGVRPPAEAIEQFLSTERFGARENATVDKRPSTTSVVTPASSSHEPEKSVTATLVRRSEASRGPTTYSFQGDEYHATSAMTATIALINLMEQHSPGSVADAAPRVSGRRRRYLAQSPAALYDRADQEEFARQLECGWFIDTNIANRTKGEIIRAIGKSAGLVDGVNFDVSFEGGR